MNMIHFDERSLVDVELRIDKVRQRIFPIKKACRSTGAFISYISLMPLAVISLVLRFDVNHILRGVILALCAAALSLAVLLLWFVLKINQHVSDIDLQLESLTAMVGELKDIVNERAEGGGFDKNSSSDFNGLKIEEVTDDDGSDKFGIEVEGLELRILNLYKKIISMVDNSEWMVLDLEKHLGPAYAKMQRS